MNIDNKSEVFVPLRERRYPKSPNRPARVPSFINEQGQIEQIQTGTTVINQLTDKDVILGVVKNGLFGI